MILKSSCLIVFSLCIAPICWAQQTITVGQAGSRVPAGTLLGCILDEPNFSSKTARPGDPLLCKTNSSVEMFGRPLIPRGTYLTARLRNYRDPGHFVGKGWLQLEFASLILPGGSISLDAKVISAARYKVTGDGKIQGRGHATRDAVEWAIPLLWPVKVLTLPARGPRPNFKGETQIELRLMEDIVIPDAAYTTAGVFTPRSSDLQVRSSDSGFVPNSGARLANYQPNRTGTAAQTERFRPAAPVNRDRPPAPPSRYTILALRGGQVYLADDYWVNRGNLNYTREGSQHSVPLGALDVSLTRQLNAERGMPFVLSAKTY